MSSLAECSTANNEFERACCLVMALAFFVAGVATLLDPSQQQPGRFWHILLTQPEWFLVARYALLLAALAGLGVAGALRDRLDGVHRGAAQWLFRIAQLSLFAMALVNVQLLSVDVLYTRLDTKASLWLGGLGLWAVGASLLAWRGSVLPRRAVFAGLVTGIILVSIPVLGALGNQVLWLLAVMTGSMILSPLWLMLLAKSLGTNQPLP